MKNIAVSTEAQAYLVKLLDDQKAQEQDSTDNEPEVVGIRLYINDPGTPNAETCIAYCRDKDVGERDELITLDSFKLWLDYRSLLFLEDAEVSYEENTMGGQLTIKAPNSKMPQVNNESPLEDRVNYILYNEINPSLASHGGEVSLLEMVEDDKGHWAVLQFGGGCQGCGMVDVTLKEGIEKTLLEKIPGLSGVRDTTDHSVTDNAFY